jgi:hypothetical protein
VNTRSHSGVGRPEAAHLTFVPFSGQAVAVPSTHGLPRFTNTPCE